MSPCRSLGLLLTLTVCACSSAHPPDASAPASPATAAPTGDPLTVFTTGGDAPGLGEAIAHSICEGRPVVFKGTGIRFYTRIALWLMGDQRGDFFRFPGTGDDYQRGVRIFDSPVRGDGSFEATYAFSPAIGPMPNGGTLTLASGRSLGLMFQVAEQDGVLRDGTYSTLQLPSAPCATMTSLPSPDLAIEKTGECLPPGQDLHLKGRGLVGDRVHLLVLGFGEMPTRRPRIVKDLGFVELGADGSLDTRAAAGDLAPADYLLTVFDDHDTRRTDVPFTFCVAPSPVHSDLP